MKAKGYVHYGKDECNESGKTPAVERGEKERDSLSRSSPFHLLPRAGKFKPLKENLI